MSEKNTITAINQAVLVVSGPDRLSFLQGLMTNDILLLSHQPALYTCLLSPQGKFLHDLFILAKDDTCLLVTEKDRAHDLFNALLRYRLRAKIDINFNASLSCGLSLTNPENSAVTYFQDPRHPELGYRLIHTSPFEINTNIIRQWDERRIELGIADGSRDADIGLSTLEELNIPDFHGVSYTKGCYVGQELTARMHHRGLGKKHLRAFIFKENAPENRPDITCGEMIVGQLRSVQGRKALALIKDEHLSSPLKCLGQEIRRIQ